MAAWGLMEILSLTGHIFMNSYSERTAATRGVTFVTILDISMVKVITKRQRKSDGQSRMDNPRKLSTLGTQDTRWRQTKQKTQHRRH